MFSIRGHRLQSYPFHIFQVQGYDGEGERILIPPELKSQGYRWNFPQLAGGGVWTRELWTTCRGICIFVSMYIQCMYIVWQHLSMMSLDLPVYLFIFTNDDAWILPYRTSSCTCITQRAEQWCLSIIQHLYTLAFLACGHYSASILHSVPEANKIQQKLSRDFHVDLTPRDMAVKQTKSGETSSSELIQANNFHMPINNWRSMKQISFLFSRVDGSLDLDGLGCMMCLGHLWLVDIALRCLTPWLFGRFHPEYLIRLVWIIYV